MVPQEPLWMTLNSSSKSPSADICHPKEHDLKEREQLCRAQVT